MTLEQKYDRLRAKGWVRNPAGTRWQKGFRRILQSDVEVLREEDFGKLLDRMEALAAGKR